MFHESVGIAQKIEFEIRPDLGCYNHQNVDIYIKKGPIY